MDATASIVSFPKPMYWDEIIAYAKLNRSTGNTEKLLPVRPSVEHSRAALQDLLQQIKFQRSHVNAGYLHALNLTVPQP